MIDSLTGTAIASKTGTISTSIAIGSIAITEGNYILLGFIALFGSLVAIAGDKTLNKREAAIFIITGVILGGFLARIIASIVLSIFNFEQFRVETVYITAFLLGIVLGPLISRFLQRRDEILDKVIDRGVDKIVSEIDDKTSST